VLDAVNTGPITFDLQGNQISGGPQGPQAGDPGTATFDAQGNPIPGVGTTGFGTEFEGRGGTITPLTGGPTGLEFNRDFGGGVNPLIDENGDLRPDAQAIMEAMFPGITGSPDFAPLAINIGDQSGIPFLPNEQGGGSFLNPLDLTTQQSGFLTSQARSDLEAEAARRAEGRFGFGEDTGLQDILGGLPEGILSSEQQESLLAAVGEEQNPGFFGNLQEILGQERPQFQGLPEGALLLGEDFFTSRDRLESIIGPENAERFGDLLPTPTVTDADVTGDEEDLLGGGGGIFGGGLTPQDLEFLVNLNFGQQRAGAETGGGDADLLAAILGSLGGGGTDVVEQETLPFGPNIQPLVSTSFSQ